MKNNKKNIVSMESIIEELRRQGVKVEARKRTDGGYIITKINGVSYSGASGNSAAREMLGVQLSEARIKQLNYNVEKYIKVGKGKRQKRLDDDMEKKLRKVQRNWNKNKVGGKAKVTAKKVKWYIKENGKEAAGEYLDKMKRYGSGLAYEDNVDFLVQYIQDFARGLELTTEEYANKFYQLAEFIASKKEIFKEVWIQKIYQVLYTVYEIGFDESTLEAALTTIYSIIQ
jgi:hypothetical protein